MQRDAGAILFRAGCAKYETNDLRAGRYAVSARGPTRTGSRLESLYR